MVLEEGSVKELGEEDAEFIGLCDEGQLFFAVVRVTRILVLTGIFVCEVFLAILYLGKHAQYSCCNFKKTLLASDMLVAIRTAIIVLYRESIL